MKAASDDRDYTRLLEETNALLKFTGYGSHAFQNVDELVSSISSMCVALYERFFDVRLDNVRREPRSLDDYSHNAQLVVDGLSAALLTEELQHVTGAKVCGGDLVCIRELVRVLTQVYHMLHRPLSRLASSNSSNDMALDQTFYIKRQAKKKNPGTKKGATTNSNSSSGRTDPSLQTTKKYGRFVPLAGSSNGGTSFGGRDSRPRPQSKAASGASHASQVTSHQPRSSTASKSKSRESSSSLRRPTPSTQVAMPRALDFGSVSSVSFADGDGDELTGLDFSDSNDDIASSRRLSHELSKVASELASLPLHPRTRHDDDGGSLHVDDLAASMVQLPIPPSRPTQSLPSPQVKQSSSELSWDDEDAPRSPEPTKSRPASMVQPPAAPSKLFHDHFAKVRPLHRAGAAASKDRLQQRRYKALLHEHVQDMRVKEMKVNQHIARSFQNKKHADHIERVLIRTKKLQDELKLQRIALGVQQKRAEAQNLKDTMEHLLSLEKMRLKQEHEETTAALQAIQRQHADREQALENYFANQIDLVREQREHEVRERNLVQQAHKLASEQLLRELRTSRETEVAALMDQRRHLADVQQVRQERKAAQFIEQQTMHALDLSKKRIDPFYAAAMKSRAKRHERSKQVERVYKGGAGNLKSVKK